MRKTFKLIVIIVLLVMPALSAATQLLAQTQQLTYYVNGRRRTANVVFYGTARLRYFVDNGGNIVEQSSVQWAGERSWSNWRTDGIVIRRSQMRVPPHCVLGVYGAMLASLDFLSANEIRDGRDRFILIHQRNNRGEFMWIEGNFVHVIRRMYKRQAGNVQPQQQQQAQRPPQQQQPAQAQRPPQQQQQPPAQAQRPPQQQAQPQAQVQRPPQQQQQQQQVSERDFVVDVIDDGVRITGFNGNSTVVNIPETIGGRPVRVIGFRAFFERGLTSVTIPNSVQTIGMGAFANNNLTSVTIGNSVQTIESRAFYNNNLTSVTIPNSVQTIDTHAFWNNNLTRVTIPRGSVARGVMAFNPGVRVTEVRR